MRLSKVLQPLYHGHAVLPLLEHFTRSPNQVEQTQLAWQLPYRAAALLPAKRAKVEAEGGGGKSTWVVT